MTEPTHHRSPYSEHVAVRDRHRPLSWGALRAAAPSRWVVPFMFADWLCQWAVFALSRLSILELLEYCGSLSILVAVIFYFLDAPQRIKLKHYQAWQVINTAQGKGGSGGRIEALGELNEDRVPLIGVDLRSAFLQGVRLGKADLSRATLGSADMRNADLHGAKLDVADMIFTNLRGADLSGADLSDADLTDADLTGADLRNVKLSRANLSRVDLRGVDLTGVRDWQTIRGVHLANIHGLRGAPKEFPAWALTRGAVDMGSDDQWLKLLDRDKSGAASQPGQ